MNTDVTSGDYHAELERLVSDDSNFIYKLRALNGLDKDGLRDSMDLLDRIRIAVADQDLIGKKLAYLLIGIDQILNAVAFLYTGAQQQEILEALGYVSEKIGSVFECET